MSQVARDAKLIFLEAIEQESPEDIARLLDVACHGDANLRIRVEQLLQAHRNADRFLGGAETNDSSCDPPLTETLGAQIGPYKLLQQIGEGGMGVVYMADQSTPVRRKVALKIIKPGMDTREVIARFEVERQALALMDHPNIARVFDAGSTQAGLPYFVMELVRGVPVTDYCDQNNLPVRERLELFVTVCHAVQHAHQKGIIHRDIKPNNVLVTLHDGRPVPKVIDFGVAKAISQQLTEKTLFTQFAQMVGTPLYMSPEQAELTGLDIDTRGDIYSLGVLLYELLTGTTPFGRARMKQAALEEIRRIIREEDPPPPSLRLSSTVGESQTAVAAHRRVDPKVLSRLMRGDLDWIVMKALEKDRTRRYETANGFASDVKRYLNDEPVEACPPSAGYKLRKYARKHKRAFLLATAFAALLVLGVVVSTWQAVRATWAESDAVAQRDKAVTAAAAERQAKIDAEQSAESERRAKESAQKRLAQIEKGNEILGSIFKDLDPDFDEKDSKPLRVMLGKRLELAAKQLEGEAVGDPVAVARLQRTLGGSLLRLGYPEKAIDLFSKARATLTTRLGPKHPDTLFSMADLAEAYWAVGKQDLALPLFEETLKLRTAQLGPQHFDTLTSMDDLALGYRATGKLDLALQLHEQTFELRKAKLGPDHPDTLVSMANVATCYTAAGKLDLSLQLHEQTLQIMQEKLGPDHSNTHTVRNNFAEAYRAAGRLDLAVALHEQTLKLRKAKLGPDHPSTLQSMQNLALCYHALRKPDLALPLYEEAVIRRKARFGPEHEETLASIKNLIALYTDWAKPDEAARWQGQWDQALREAGFIRDWLILAGPVPDSDPDYNRQMDAQYLPGEAQLQPQADDRARLDDHEFVWKKHHAQDYWVDFNAFCGELTPQGVAYAVCYVIADEARQDLELKIGSDDMAKIYLNGQQLFRSVELRPLIRDQDCVKHVSLKKGTNVLMFKVVNVMKDWSGCIRIVESDGRGAQGIHVSLTP